MEKREDKKRVCTISSQELAYRKQRGQPTSLDRVQWYKPAASSNPEEIGKKQKQQIALGRVMRDKCIERCARPSLRL
jgi:hypothetical protein